MGPSVKAGEGRAPPANQDISRLRLAVVTPMANEAASAERFLVEVLHHCRASGACDVVLLAVLDRVSRDGTLDLLRALVQRMPELRVIYAPENRNVVDAYFRGYADALAAGADWILEMDAGFSHQPVEIPQFLATIVRGSEVAFATRFAQGGSYAGGVSRRWLVSWLGSQAARLFLGMRLSDMTSGFQLFSRDALTEVVTRGVRSRGPFFQTEIKAMLRHRVITEVPISYRPTAQALPSDALGDAIRTLFALSVERLRNAP